MHAVLPVPLFRKIFLKTGMERLIYFLFCLNMPKLPLFLRCRLLRLGYLQIRAVLEHLPNVIHCIRDSLLAAGFLNLLHALCQFRLKV